MWSIMEDQTTPPLDPRVIASFREGDPDGASGIVSLLIDQFLDEAAMQTELLRAAGQRGDAAALRSAAHNLKGSSTTMGAKRLGAACRAVEAYAAYAATVAHRPDGMTELMLVLDRELADVRDALLVEREGGNRS
jgi:HPt (histidine-containing phosphotransfer) domain-containing protein